MSQSQHDEPACECQGPGRCERYQIEQTQRTWELCSGNCPIENPCSKYTSLKYRQKWARRRDGVEATPVSGGANAAGPNPEGGSVKARKQADPKPPIIGFGPGTELMELLRLLGFRACERCRELAERMDRWGVAGCREPANEAVILGRLREKQAKASWLARINAGVKAAGMLLILNPLDPAPGLLAEAIRMAEAKPAQAGLPAPG